MYTGIDSILRKLHTITGRRKKARHELSLRLFLEMTPPSIVPANLYLNLFESLEAGLYQDLASEYPVGHFHALLFFTLVVIVWTRTVLVSR